MTKNIALNLCALIIFFSQFIALSTVIALPTITKALSLFYALKGESCGLYKRKMATTINIAIVGRVITKDSNGEKVRFCSRNIEKN